MRAMKIVALCLAVGGCLPTAEQRMQQVWAHRQCDENKCLSVGAKPGDPAPMCSAGRTSTPLGPGGGRRRSGQVDTRAGCHHAPKLTVGGPCLWASAP
jgi:hypothetical protein